MRIYDLPAVTRLSPTDEFRVSIAEGGYKKISLVDFRTALSIPEIPPVPIFEKWPSNGPLTGWPTEAAAVASLPADGGRDCSGVHLSPGGNPGDFVRGGGSA